MILGTLAHSERYASLHPLFKMVFDYVKTHDLTTVPTGRIELQGDALFINVAEPTLKEATEQVLEVHREYIDIHFPLTHTETIGWRDLETLEEPDAPFNATDDYALYTAPASTYIDVKPGEFLIVYPEDAHAPIIGKGQIRKLIAKVRL